MRLSTSVWWSLINWLHGHRQDYGHCHLSTPRTRALERRTLGEECLVGKYTTKQTIKHLAQLVRINCGLPDRRGNTQKSNGRRCSNSATTSACAVALNIAGEILSVKSTSCLSARVALMALTIFSLFAGSATPPRGSTLSISCSSFGFACGPRSELRVRV